MKSKIDLNSNSKSKIDLNKFAKLILKMYID